LRSGDGVQPARRNLHGLLVPDDGQAPLLCRRRESLLLLLDLTCFSRTRMALACHRTDAVLEMVQLVALAVLTGLCALFMYKYLPETKGRSLEEMLGYFQQIANTQGGLDATQASAQMNRPSCLGFQRARVLAVADLCACATQACWTARRPSLALGSSSQTRRPSHQQSPWRHRPEHAIRRHAQVGRCAKAGEGLAPARPIATAAKIVPQQERGPGAGLACRVLPVMQYIISFTCSSDFLARHPTQILLVEKKTQASVHSHADLLIFLIAALSFLYTSSLRSLAPAVEPAVVL